MLQLLCAWLGAAAFAASLAYFLFSYIVTFGETPTSAEATAGRTAAVVIDVALFSAFALHHSLFARTGLKAAVRRVVPPALERSLYTWVASLLFFLVCWAWEPVAGVLYSVPSPWHVLGYGLQAAGIVITFYGSRALDVLDLAGVRQVMTPKLEPGHVALQTSGVYGLVRHPVYFAWVLLVFGAPHMTMTRFVFASVSTLYLAVAVPFEERGLVDVFGQSYNEYRTRVRWRMIPFVY